MSAPGNHNLIPRRPLLWLSAALLFLVPTFIGHILQWAPLLLLCSLLAKCWMQKTDRRLRSVLWKSVLALAGFGAVYLSYGSLSGIEPGVTLLVVLASLKILESHTARDFHVLIMVGWGLCLCAFLLSQDFSASLWVLAAFVLLVAALIQFHQRSAPGGALWPPLATTLKLFAEALPLVALLFFFFPRGTGEMRLHLPGQSSAASGFSGELSPGTVAALASSDDLAFRVEFPDANMPPSAHLYWRGAVLWHGDGLNWRAGSGFGEARASKRRTGGLIRQRITIEPHAGRWLFALDRPLNAPAGASLAPGRYLSSVRPVSSIRRYEVLSASEAGEENLHPRERAASLQIPATISPAVRALVQTWTAQGKDPRAVVKAALEFFRTKGFLYSLSPGTYGGTDAVDDLLFRRKTGFCEHYAGAFATLMRVAGIPSRIVVGYLGGQFNQYGNYLLVRQSDAHAWCEVWLPEAGWTRVDPTSVIAPERLSLGSLHEMQTSSVRNPANAGGGQTRSSLPSSGLFGEIQLAWDTVSYAWDSQVLSFDDDGQRDFLTSLGLDVIPPVSQLLWILAAVALLLGLYAAMILWRSQTRPGGVTTLYQKFCREAARLGVERSATEGPADFGRRAANLLPQHATSIQRIASTYIALRYSPHASPSVMHGFAAEVRDFIRSSHAR